MRQELERVVAANRFSMPTLCEGILPLLEQRRAVAASIPQLREALGEAYRDVLCGIIRHAFLIELVKVPKIETTKVRVRWSNQLDGDQRFCSFNECLQIVEDLVGQLADGWFEEERHRELLELFLNHRMLSYELPLDYEARPPLEDQASRIHRPGNLCWTATDTMRRTLLLRRFLTSPQTSPDAEFFTKALRDKIKVKTYLTDRVLTGDFKTNREKRWEVHPRSVHFADRRTCLAIEYTLVVQLCSFQDFPDRSREMLQAERILPVETQTFGCPITLEPMSFPKFQAELQNPVMGRSNFQVGHLNPLKLDAGEEEASGHTAENISWISADGNRVQGSQSLAQVRRMLRRIAARYETRGWE